MFSRVIYVHKFFCTRVIEMFHKIVWFFSVLVLSKTLIASSFCHSFFQHKVIADTIGEVVKVDSSHHKILLNPEIHGPEEGGWRPPVFALWGIEQAAKEPEAQHRNISSYGIIQEFAYRSSPSVEVFHFHADVVLKVDYKTEELGFFRKGRVLTYLLGRNLFGDIIGISRNKQIKFFVELFTKNANFYLEKPKVIEDMKFTTMKRALAHKKHFEKFNVFSVDEYVDLLNSILKRDEKDDDQLSMVINPFFKLDYDYRAVFNNFNFSTESQVAYQIMATSGKKSMPMSLLSGFVVSNDTSLANAFHASFGLSKYRINELMYSIDFDFDGL